MFTYELIQNEVMQIVKRSDGAWIPLDPANSDYAEYLRYTEWVEAGNDPDEFWTQTELTEMGEEI
jgi:hypothetical protein